MPSLSVSLAFRIDALSAQMLALITGIGTWIFVYASGYRAHEPRRGRLFVVLLLAQMAGSWTLSGGVTPMFAGLKNQVREALVRAGLDETVGAENLFPGRDLALAALARRYDLRPA